MYIRCITSCSALTELEAVANDKKAKKSNKKDSQLVIRINGEMRDRFLALCDDLDTSAAREIRTFIKSFLRKHGGGDE